MIKPPGINDSDERIVLEDQPVLLRASGGEGSKPGHEEMKTREGNHVYGQLPEISVQLTRKPEAGGHTWTIIESYI